MQPHEGQPVLLAGAPLGHGRGAMILLHGRNASAEDILQLTPHFDPDFSYLAPAAANHTWYPFSFLVPIADNEPGLSSALDLVDGLVRQLIDRGYAADRIVLLGFSQGACLATEFAVRHAQRYGGIVALSGGLIGPPGTTWDRPGGFDGTPVFLGCSDVDAHIPKERVNETEVVFERMGARVTKRLYAGMGHTVNEDELEAVRTMLATIADASPAR
jgi:predicted esterase